MDKRKTITVYIPLFSTLNVIPFCLFFPYYFYNKCINLFCIQAFVHINVFGAELTENHPYLFEGLRYRFCFYLLLMFAFPLLYSLLSKIHTNKNIFPLLLYCLLFVSRSDSLKIIIHAQSDILLLLLHFCHFWNISSKPPRWHLLNFSSMSFSSCPSFKGRFVFFSFLFTVTTNIFFTVKIPNGFPMFYFFPFVVWKIPAFLF